MTDYWQGGAIANEAEVAEIKRRFAEEYDPTKIQVIEEDTSDTVENEWSEPGVRECGLSQEHVTKRAGITYRMLDHWSATKRLKFHRHSHGGRGPVVERGGSGVHKCWPYEEVERAARIAKLVKLGFELDRAVEYASGDLLLQMAQRELIEVELSLRMAQAHYGTEKA